MRKKKIKILHVAQAAGGVDRYIRMLLKYLDKEKFENILVCSQDFNREDYDGLVDSFEQIEMNRAIGVSDLNSIKEVRRLIKKYNPDIVYAHSSKAGAIARVADIGLKNHCVSSFSKVRTYSIVKRELCPNLLNRAQNNGGWLTHLSAGVVSQSESSSDHLTLN